MQMYPSVLLTTALQGHPNTAVEFHYGAGSSKVTFKPRSTELLPLTSPAEV
jgi:hypothetical protein